MIARALVLLVAIVASASAFTVQTSPCRRTFLSMSADNKALEQQLKSDPQLDDADRAVVLECDDTECAQLECIQDSRGNWNCEGGLEGDRPDTQKTVLMSSNKDD
mmetsp:Transcript_27682/g.65853  ORF Transcript_27682/g.65853 Transcript_27682/m.65853 type:complete len:105 (-) Transcript_27682:141-455(-)